MALTAAGRVRWTAEEPAAGGEQSAGLHVALARGGSLYVAGAAGPAPEDSDVVMARYTTAGERRWRDELDVSDGDAWREVPMAVVVDRLDNAFIAGLGDPGPVSPEHGFAARWRPGGGRWFYDGPVSSETGTPLLGVVADEAGGCYVAGRIIANCAAPARAPGSARTRSSAAAPRSPPCAPGPAAASASSATRARRPGTRVAR